MSVSKVRIGLILVTLVATVLWVSGDQSSVQTSYEGREADAPWRKAAAERIERYRKGDLVVKVLDSRGRPIPGAQVDIQMLRHAFRFGSVATQDMLLEKGPEGEKYRETLVANFNSVTLHRFYDYIWNDENNARRTQTNLPLVISWLRNKKMSLHGHVLVWNLGPGGRRSLQPIIKDEARTRVEAHFKKTIAKPEFHEPIETWDVLNEPAENSEVYDSLGPESAVRWFEEAHRLAPKATLVLNETRLCTSTRRKEWPDVVNKTEALVKYLKEHKAPVHALGIQSHQQLSDLTPIPRVLETLDRLSQLEVELMVTEFDIIKPSEDSRVQRALRRLQPGTNDPQLDEQEQLEADYLRDYLTACFSQPRMKEFTMWGFWDGDHWLRHSPLYEQNWSPKKGQKIWKMLTQETWWSSLESETNSKGISQSRVFLGDYEVEVSTRNRKSKRLIQVNSCDEATELVVTLE